MCQLLEEGQNEEEVVNGALALQVGWPLPKPLGQFLGAALEGKHPLIHGIYLCHDIHPQKVPIPFYCGNDIRVKSVDDSKNC